MATCASICKDTPRRRNVNSTDFYCDGNKRVRCLGRPVLLYMAPSKAVYIKGAVQARINTERERVIDMRQRE